MKNTVLKAALDATFSGKENLGDAFLASEAIELIYTRIEDWALEAQAKITEGKEEGGKFDEKSALETSKLLFKIQQVINFPPMDHFLKALAQDELLAIRSAAKGNLFERTGEYGDIEICIVGNANLRVMHITTELLDEIKTDPDLVKGFDEWVKAEVPDEFPYDYK